MKRKFIGIGAMLAIVCSLLVSGIAFADDPTTVEVTWDGAGEVEGTVYAGDDANASFGSAGSYQVGRFTATDQNNNPYGYNVDTCNFSFETSITGGGIAKFIVNRTDSKESSYGEAGQQSGTYAATTDGDILMQNRSSTNYAAMKDGNYGWHANDHIVIGNATLYELARWVDSGNGDYASLSALGIGSADLDAMSSEADGGKVRLGWGCGCYTNADFTATGSGQFQLQANGDTSTTTAMAPGMTGANSFNFIATWLDSTFTVPDYSTTAQ